MIRDEHEDAGNYDLEEAKKLSVVKLIGSFTNLGLGNPAYNPRRVPDFVHVVYSLPEFYGDIKTLSVVNRNEQLTGVPFEPDGSHYRLELMRNFYVDSQCGGIFTQETVTLGTVSNSGNLAGFDLAQVFKWDFNGEVSMFHLFKKAALVGNTHKTVLYSQQVSPTLERLVYVANALNFIFDGNQGILADGSPLYDIPHTDMSKN